MATVKTILYIHKKLKNGEHPVMLYIYEDKPYRLSLGESCTPKDWDEKHTKFRKAMPNFKSKNIILRQYELRANEIIDDFVRKGERFDIGLFKRKFRGEETEEQEKPFNTFFREMVEEKRALGKVGTAMSYQDALNALRKYKRKNVKFSDVNYSFLKGFEASLFKRGCKAGGISVYMRSLRAVYYEGIRRGYAHKDHNPFDTTVNRDGYSIARLKPMVNPKAIGEEELEKFKNFDVTAYPRYADAWRFWMFSFWTFGMNFIDIANLKKENVPNGRIFYTRQKTGKAFNLVMREEALNILNYYRKGAVDYVFPVFSSQTHVSPVQRKNRSKKILKRVNEHLKEIAKILDVDVNMTFYTARHTSATTLKRNGISYDVISEALGHNNPQVTQHYLKKFENTVLDGAVNML